MTIARLRKKIDSIDRQWLHLVQTRIEISCQIARIKKKQGLSYEDLERENEIRENVSAQARKLQLDEKLAQRLIFLVLAVAKRNARKKTRDALSADCSASRHQTLRRRAEKGQSLCNGE
jgi:chorismate mutase